MRRFVLSLLGLSAFIGCVSKPPHEQSWLETRTPHFEIASSLGRKGTLRLASDVERFRGAVEYVTGLKLPDPSVPTRVFAFEDGGGERRFSTGRPPGYFLPTLRGGVIVLHDGGGWRSDANQDLRHELVHYLLRNHAGLDQPLWYDEGVADFMSTALMHDDSVEIGMVRRDWVKILAGNVWIPIGRILAARDLSDWQGTQRDSFRAQAWLFVHYLNFHDKGRRKIRPRLGRYFELVGAGEPPETAVEQAFGGSLDELDHDLKNYAQRERLQMVEVRIRVPGGEPATEPMALDDVVTRLADLLLVLDRLPQGTAYYELAISENPKNAHAHAGLGVAEARRGRFRAGSKRVEAALELGPEDPQNHVDAGEFYRTRASSVRDAQLRAELLAQARKHYVESWTLDGSRPEPYARYAQTFLVGGEDAEYGLEAIDYAHRRLPSSLQIELLRARLYRRLGRHAAVQEQMLRIDSRSHSKQLDADLDGLAPPASRPGVERLK